MDLPLFLAQKVCLQVYSKKPSILAISSIPTKSSSTRFC